MEHQNDPRPEQVESEAPSVSSSPAPYAGKRELIFCAGIFVSALATANFLLFGGMNLGYCLGLMSCLGWTFGYLWASGHKGDRYSYSLLGLCVVIALGFAWSDDTFVKRVLSIFLFVGINLGLCLMAKQNARPASSAGSLLDAFYAFFSLGIGKVPDASQGLRLAFQRSGAFGKQTASVLLGLVIAVPILALLIPLLISADAAFDGMIRLLPEFDLLETSITLLFGGLLFCVLYSRGAALNHSTRHPVVRIPKKGLSSLTVNTVLGAVCLVYLMYLFSQLAYFVGGFAGILPEGYSAAEYARRGFFETSWLCILNLGVMVLGMSATRQTPGVPKVTRILCLFLGLMTLFLVAAACGKMGLYIGSFGLTRLRVLTMVILVFLGITTGVVCLWLFLPRLPYMKIILLTGLIIGAAVLWVDVDTQVARYNVDAYLSGKLASVDREYLLSLGKGAVPSIQKLIQNTPHSLYLQNDLLDMHGHDQISDFREFNFIHWIASRILKELGA